VSLFGDEAALRLDRRENRNSMILTVPYNGGRMRAFLVDDEALALKRLSRMLTATGRVEIVGSETDPVEAVQAVLEAKPDVLFLDIEMPEMTGFEMLAKLDPQPMIVFTLLTISTRCRPSALTRSTIVETHRAGATGKGARQD